MPIKEQSFRIGCGRYLQGAGIINSTGEEILRVGRAPLIVGGRTALGLTREKLEKSVSAVCENYRFAEHLGTCNDEDARLLAETAKSEGFDVIVGVGGGVIMDFAKLIAHFADLPVINIPTSSATCAAYTPLSVRYTREGHTVGSKHFGCEVNAVIADTEILLNQPPRLLLAGIFDAVAKFIEIKHRFSGEVVECPLGLDWAYVLSVHSYKELFAKAEPCLEDMRDGKLSDTVERVVFTSIAATGVISGIARGSNQTALAHKFYEATRVLYHGEARPYLHGEIVGIGLLLQNRFNGEEEKSRELLDMMKKYGMPCRVSDIGIEPTEDSLEKYYGLLEGCSAIAEGGADARSKLRDALEYLWRL
ncbi:MAG: iron-containing alcohol dehydrogenase [Clostridia bacterium]|nr:iron-containing alcohol dehydrogenase [Clostridia bacterium]